jgi:hypothetical protein
MNHQAVRRGSTARFCAVGPVMFFFAVAFFLALPAHLQSALTASTPSHPFAPGEQLTYAISWLHVRAGTAEMGIQEAPPIGGRAAFKLLTTARSNSAISKVYPINNRVESLIDAETLSPYRMTFLRREGKTRNDFDVTFRHQDRTVVDIKDGIAETTAIPPETHDLISCLYYVRSLPSMEPGSTVVLNIHHDKKNYRVEVKVEGLEQVQSPWGRIQAVRILVVLPFQGIFLNEGNIRVWLTHDARRIPVLMKAKVIIGSVTARLDSVTNRGGNV